MVVIFLCKDTGAQVEKLVILTSTGQGVSPSLSLEQSGFLNSPEPLLYLYTVTEQRSVKDYLQQPLHIPELVTAALRDARRSVQDYHQKKMFIHGYHFVNEQFQNLATLKKGLKILHQYLTEKMKDISEESDQLKPRQEKIRAKFELFKESVEHEQARYQEQASRKDRITSKKMVDHWNKTERDMEQLTDEVCKYDDHLNISYLQVSSRIDLVQETVHDVTKRLHEAQTREVLTGPSEDAELKVGESK